MEASASPPGADSRRRIRAVVALRLLEVLREQDAPPEMFEEEDPTVTMPRRLGLSEVVERQIRTYRSNRRHGVRLTDSEVLNLFRLVIRRPDSEEIFRKLGRLLAGVEEAGKWRRFMPKTLAYAAARGRARRKLKALFGRQVGGFARGPFSIEGRSLFFIQADPGGDACAFLSGFCEAVLEQASGRPGRMVHSHCQARGDPLCRWEGRMLDESAAVGAAVATGTESS